MKPLLRLLLLLVGLSARLVAVTPVEVLVQGAEKLEIEAIVAALKDAERHDVGDFPFWVGTLGEHRVAVSLTGQALISCTAATVIGIEEFHPKLIINQGTAGAQAPRLRVRDIIVGTSAVDYGNFISNPLGKDQGSRPLTWKPLPQGLRNRYGKWETFPNGFWGDEACVALALRVKNPAGRVFAGVVGSAHEVNLEMDRVKWTRETFKMDVEEMESAHVAALARAFDVRYVTFRVVSDAPYERILFQPEAAIATAEFTVMFLHQLPRL